MHLLLGGGGIDILAIAGLTGWWSADDGVYSDAGTTPAVDTNTVQQWNNRVVGSDNFTQGAAGNRPTYRTGIVNGRPVLRFGGGTDDDFMASSNLSVFLAAGAKTFFAVHKWTANNDSSVLGSSVETFFMQQTSAGAASTFYHHDGSLDSATIGSLTPGDWYITSGMHSGGSIYCGVNDTRTASMNSAASGDTSNLATALLVGFRSGGTPQPNDGDIAEILVFNVALSESTRTSIEQYLASKYAITLPY